MFTWSFGLLQAARSRVVLRRLFSKRFPCRDLKYGPCLTGGLERCYTGRMIGYGTIGPTLDSIEKQIGQLGTVLKDPCQGSGLRGLSPFPCGERAEKVFGPKAPCA